MARFSDNNKVDAGQDEPSDVGTIREGDESQDATDATQNEQFLRSLDAIQGAMIRKRDEWVAHRYKSGVEERWKHNADLYYGRNDVERATQLETVLKYGPPAVSKRTDPIRSKAVINIVRPKCKTILARLCQILLPTDDNNWGIKPAPVPELAKFLDMDDVPHVEPITGVQITDTQGNPLTISQHAAQEIQKAKEAAGHMERDIDADLELCNFNGEERRMLRDGVILGTGVLKGPFPKRYRSKVWLPQADGTQLLQIQEELRPATVRVDPWDIYFDPACGGNHQNGTGVFEKRSITEKELRELIGMPGFIEGSIKTVLGQKPKVLMMVQDKPSRVDVDTDAYQLWMYMGDIAEEDMAILSTAANDPLAVTQGVIWFVNDMAIGAMDTWVPDKTFPYDVWNYEEAEDSPYGYGVPDELDHQQRVVNSAWRLMLDAARNSSGPQIIFRKGSVTPADGNSQQLTPNKLWIADQDTPDVRQVFDSHTFDGPVEDLSKIVQLAMEYAEQESSAPLITQGMQGSSTDTVGGMEMLDNNATAPLKLLVKRFDDTVTSMHIERYHDWHMSYSPKPEVKGDFHVIARGSNVLMEKDAQNVQAMNLLKVAEDPNYAIYFNKRWVVETVMRGYFKISPDDALRPQQEVDADLKAQQQQQAQAQQQGQPQGGDATAQVAMAEIQDRDKERQFEMQKMQQDQSFQREVLQADQQKAQTEQQIEVAKLQATREKAASDVRVQGAQMVHERQMQHTDLAHKRDVKNADLISRQQDNRQRQMEAARNRQIAVQHATQHPKLSKMRVPGHATNSGKQHDAAMERRDLAGEREAPEVQSTPPSQS